MKREKAYERLKSFMMNEKDKSYSFTIELTAKEIELLENALYNNELLLKDDLSIYESSKLLDNTDDELSTRKLLDEYAKLRVNVFSQIKKQLEK